MSTTPAPADPQTAPGSVFAPFAYPERARIDVIDGDVRDAAALDALFAENGGDQ